MRTVSIDRSQLQALGLLVLGLGAGALAATLTDGVVPPALVLGAAVLAIALAERQKR